MNNKTKLGIVAVIFIVLVVSAWKLDKDYGLFGGHIGGGAIQEACFPLEGYGFGQDENGAYLPPESFMCVSGAWVNTSKQNGSDSYCNAYFELVTVEYVDGEPVITKTEAQGDEFCYDGRIIRSPSGCGDYVCQAGETAMNCWPDCGPIQSWEEMKGLESEFQTYLESEFEFDYQSPEVEELAREVEATNPRSPFYAVKTLTRLINDKIYYVSGGTQGNVQCGEKPEEILSRGFGNCVDYSVVMIAVLRRGFDVDGVRVKIPARQVAGCLSGRGTWGATEFLIKEFDKGDLAGEILGHSWVEVAVGDGRWAMLDATTNVALFRSWWGYYPVGTTDGASLCYVPVESTVWCSEVSE